jgi:hypothetical protein
MDSLRTHAQSVAATDPRWLRAITNGLLWLILAMLFPWLFLVVGVPERSLGSWLTFDRVRLAVFLTPAVLAIAASWRMGTAPRGVYRSAEDDQPVTRWLVRGFALVWLLPLCIIAGPFNDPPVRLQSYELLLLLLGWSSLITTLLFFRRLKYVARQIKSRLLGLQCDVIGSQWPVATVLLAIVLGHEFISGRYAFWHEPDALVYAATTPLPAAGLPWLLVVNADRLGWLNWNYVEDNPKIILKAWPTFIHVATFILVVEFLMTLIRIRRRRLSYGDLPTYSRDLLQKIERDPAPAEHL